MSISSMSNFENSWHNSWSFSGVCCILVIIMVLNIFGWFKNTMKRLPPRLNRNRRPSWALNLFFRTFNCVFLELFDGWFNNYLLHWGLNCFSASLTTEKNSKLMLNYVAIFPSNQRVVVGWIAYPFCDHHHQKLA